MIMFALVWWSYPVVMACVAVPMAFFWYLEHRREVRADRQAEPFPCLTYMGRDVYTGELWCWLQSGHDGEHADQCGLPCNGEDFEYVCLPGGEDIDTIAFGEESLPLPGLPQRLSRVPTQTEHRDPWPQCRHQSSDGRCVLASGHVMEHEYI